MHGCYATVSYTLTLHTVDETKTLGQLQLWRSSSLHSAVMEVRLQNQHRGDLVDCLAMLAQH